LGREHGRFLKRPVIVENDANVAALAERVLGQGSEFKVDSLCMLTLGMGVGSGIVLHGNIWHGMKSMAGESGHVSVDPFGSLCVLSGRGDAWSCRPLLLAFSRAHERASLNPDGDLGELSKTNPGFNVSDLFDLAMHGDRDSIELFEVLGEALGRGLSGLVNSLNLPLYVIGGGVASVWEMFAPTMLDELAQRSSLYRLTDPRRAPKQQMAKAETHVVPAKLGSTRAFLGPASCHLKSMFAPRGFRKL
jgi:glucokinase